MSPTAAQVYEPMDLAARIGEVLLSSGSSAADTSATMAAVLESYGITGAGVDVTFTSMTISYQATPQSAPETHMRVIRYRSQDYSRLTRCTDLVLRICDRELTVAEARAELDLIVSAAHPYRRRLSILAWGVVAAAVAVLLGGGPFVAGSAFASACTVSLVNRALHNARIPPFFQQLAGAFIATMFTLVLFATGYSNAPSLVLVSGIIILLAGTTFTGAVEDALTGYYITACARMLEAGFLTGGVIAGVSLGLGVAGHFGSSFAATEQTFTLVRLPLMLAAAAVASAAGAYASYAPKRALPAAGLAGAAGEGVFMTAHEVGAVNTWAAGAAAVIIGAAAYTLAGRMKLPPLLLTMSGIVPLLPGLSIYTGLFELTDDGGHLHGILRLATALTTAAALAAGVMLGSRLAEPLKFGGRLVEGRLRTRITDRTRPGPRPSSQE